MVFCGLGGLSQRGQVTPGQGRGAGHVVQCLGGGGHVVHGPGGQIKGTPPGGIGMGALVGISPVKRLGARLELIYYSIGTDTAYVTVW